MYFPLSTGAYTGITGEAVNPARVYANTTQSSIVTNGGAGTTSAASLMGAAFYDPWAGETAPVNKPFMGTLANSVYLTPSSAPVASPFGGRSFGYSNQINLSGGNRFFGFGGIMDMQAALGIGDGFPPVSSSSTGSI